MYNLFQYIPKILYVNVVWTPSVSMSMGALDGPHKYNMDIWTWTWQIVWDSSGWLPDVLSPDMGDLHGNLWTRPTWAPVFRDVIESCLKIWLSPQHCCTFSPAILSIVDLTCEKHYGQHSDLVAANTVCVCVCVCVDGVILGLCIFNKAFMVQI